MIKKNAIVGQSGGPTCAINATLAGVIAKCIKSEEIDILYGACNGIKGLLREDFINLTEIFSDNDKIELLKQTPSAYLGSCRFKLTEDKDCDRIVQILKKHNIGYFFYIGGNDSMDTVLRLSEKYKDEVIKFIGIPKTIDNDLDITDHCPGFGSCAKYIATVCAEVYRDSSCYDVDNVTIIEIMGRNAGWLTASSSLARVNNCPAPHLIYLPERAFDMESFVNDVKDMVKKHQSVVVAVSEGIKDKDGNYVASQAVIKEDLFGHTQLGGAGKTLENVIKNLLKIKVRSIELNTPQRCASHLASKTDIEDSFIIGGCGVVSALNGESGKMMAYVRSLNKPYTFSVASTDIKNTANAEKKVPCEFINERGNDITPAFIDYALPLIQGEVNIVYENGIPKHLSRK